MTPRTIGVLGGMGPAATVDLMQRVINAVGAGDDADHVPMLVDQNPQVPSRIKALIDQTGDDPAPVLIAMAQRLQTAGAKALVMPCNTAHHYADAIADSVDIPFLNMIHLAAKAAQKHGAVGVLGSPAIKQVSLYAKALPNALYPADQDALLQAIRMVKMDGPTDSARAILQAASDDLAAQGAAAQLIACTEFSLISDAVPSPCIDTLDVLVDAIIDFSFRSDRNDG
ncbi:aspartate/glutamate racemase family protein [Sulfitobacter sp. 1151]|uniref:Aspartate/glutamate racemase family protein n=1 Tax=Parasulfitobacter algicola TaxID=2614809 RepID=A0ABX2IMY4_9RHOB|nr:aspartate/glutamate racemase family protein [Sulfitobacter algicola]